MHIVEKITDPKSFSIQRRVSKHAKILPNPVILGLRQWVGAIPEWKHPFRAINRLFPPRKIESLDASCDLEECQELVKKEPWNPKAHLALAKKYEGNGEKEKANAEYFLAAEIFHKNGSYPHAVSIYKQIEKSDPSLEMVRLKMADVYKKMGLLDDAFSQYSQLLNHYHDLGWKDKCKEILVLMVGCERKDCQPDEKAYVKYRLMKESSEPQEREKGRSEFFTEETEKFFDLSAELDTSEPIDAGDGKKISVEKIYGYEDILKELKKSDISDQVYSNYYYQLGLACLEMGFINEAVDHFQLAIEKGQNPLEAARLLGACFEQKGSDDIHRQPPENSRKNVVN